MYYAKKLLKNVWIWVSLGLGLLAGVIFIVLLKKRTGSGSIDTSNLERQIEDAAIKSWEAQRVYAIEVTAAKTKDEMVKSELKTILKQESGNERRRKLAELYSRTIR